MEQNESPFYFRRKGTLKIIILLSLSERKKKGIHIIEEIERRSMGFWRPSPGTIYPYLKELQNEGLITKDNEGNYTLTEEGEKYVESRFGEALYSSKSASDRCINEIEGCIEMLSETNDLSDESLGRLKEIRGKLDSIISRVN